MTNQDRAEFESELKAAIDGKTKPVGALGRMETLACQLARIQSTLKPTAESCSLIIFAGDHGMASAGVSAYPQTVTQQMVLNFLSGGAAANVFAQSVGADVYVVDSGVAGEEIEHPNLLQKRVGLGTANAIETAAMTTEQFRIACVAGTELGRTPETDVICFGEMGIGNTSSAALVTAKVLGRPIAQLVGRGTGLDDEGLARKSGLLEKAATRTDGQLTAETALTEYGGFEIVMMAAAMISAAKAGRVVIVDGFISGSAALCAKEMSPGCEAAFIYSHQSAELGHKVILDELEAKPLLELEMRLGEGTGALLAFPLVKAAAAMLRDMASFKSANVSGPV